MKVKNLAILGFVTIAISLVIPLSQTQKPTSILQSGTALFPKLLSQLNQVEAVEIVHKKQQINLVKGIDYWGIKERNGYPIVADKLRKTLLGIAEITILEPKTKKTERYAHLDLQEVYAENANSTQIKLIGANTSILADILIGKTKSSRNATAKAALYVRKPGDPQSWLVAGQVPLHNEIKDWLKTTLLELDDKRIHKVSLDFPGVESFGIHKPKLEDTDYQLNTLLATESIDSQYTVNQIASTWSRLSFDDVHAKSDITTAAKPDFSATMETFDGLRIVMHAFKYNNKTLASLAAEFAAPSVTNPEIKNATVQSDKPAETSPLAIDTPVVKPASTKEKTSVNVEQEAKKLSTSWNNWFFDITTSQLDAIRKHRSELLEKPKEHDKLPDDSK